MCQEPFAAIGEATESLMDSIPSPGLMEGLRFEQAWFGGVGGGDLSSVSLQQKVKGQGLIEDGSGLFHADDWDDLRVQQADLNKQ